MNTRTIYVFLAGVGVGIWSVNGQIFPLFLSFVLIGIVLLLHRRGL